MNMRFFYDNDVTCSVYVWIQKYKLTPCWAAPCLLFVSQSPRAHLSPPRPLAWEEPISPVQLCSMGFDVNRFEGEVDEELICTICSCVLEDPLQAPQCEHAFCSACINEWLTRQPTCPVDRAAISPTDLKVRELLNSLWCVFLINSFDIQLKIKSSKFS